MHKIGDCITNMGGEFNYINCDCITTIKKGKNLFNIAATTANYLGANGAIARADKDNLLSGYIKVKPNTVYTYTCGGYVSESPDTSWTGWMYYKDDVGTISSIITTRQGGTATNNYTSDNRTFTTPSDCNYIRIGSRFLSRDGAWAQLEEGSPATDYEPYIGW